MIDAKISFMDQLKEQMSGSLTVDQMDRLIRECTDLLDRFDMFELKPEDEKDDLLDCYISALNVQCRSQKTIDRYKYVIERMMHAIGVPTRRITVYHLRNYLAAEKARGVQDSTLEGLRQVFSGYFNWLQREGLIERNPTANLGGIKVAKKEKKTYTPVDIEKLNKYCNTARDIAIISFLSATGCRISEMTSLNRDAVNLKTDMPECIVHGKGNKERTVYMSGVTAMYLNDYLTGRKDDNQALFVNRYGKRLKPGGVRAMLVKVAEKAGVEHVHPHKFRRTLATDLSRHGMPIQEVAAILGHEKLDTTMKYVIMNKDDIRNSYRRYT